jgi:CO/xanthine dehydrogenase FAD-binding subunit
VVNPTYLDYPLPRAADAPRVRTVLVEGPDAAGPYSAKGVGELPLVPCAPAVANAVHHAVGVRLRELPLTPDRVLAALRGERALSARVRVRGRPSRWWVEGVRRAYPLGLHRLLDRYGTRLARPATPSRIEAVDRPETVAEAAAALRAGGRALGGGTDLLPDGVRSRRERVRLVSLVGVPGLRSLTRTAAGDLRIGAAVTLAELQHGPLVPPVLARTVAEVATPQIREAATVAGNLLQEKRCWFYRNGFTCYRRGGATCPCYAVLGDHSAYHAAVGAHRCQAVTPSDLATTLVALDATAWLRRPDGRRRPVAVADLYTGPGETVVGPRDLVEAVTVPAAACARAGAFAKLNRWSGDFAMVSVAMVADVDDAGRLVRPVVVLGGIAPTPWRPRPARAPDRLTPAGLAERVAAELVRAAHPLPGTGWKLDAAVGLVARTARRLVAGGG